MTQHTPGPWTIEEYGDDDAPALVIHKDSETRVCFMATAGSHGDPAKIEADARLIAAAPELLTLVKDLADDLASEVEGRYQDVKAHPAMTPKYERDMANVYRARAAIAKAEGNSLKPLNLKQVQQMFEAKDRAALAKAKNK